MSASSQQATIRQLLALAYLVMVFPAIVFVVLFVDAIDIRIEGAQRTRVDGTQFALSTNPRNTWLLAIGSTLRKANLPGAVSPVLDINNPTNLGIAQSLSDLRAAVIYVWAGIFILGGLVIWWLGIKLNQPLHSLTVSIRRLARTDYVDPVVIQGPRNIREMGQGLEKLRLKLQESDSHQRQFLRHVSHEIKTPLTSIKEGSQLLEDEILGPINSEQREITSILTKSTAELQQSIENLLNYNSAISVDKIKTRSTTDLSSLIEEVISKQALAIRSKGLKIKKDLAIARAFVDRDQISTVFDNLLSNAVKYSPDGGEINLWLTQDKKNSIFTIRDYGPGVSDANKRAIFDAFYVGNQAQHTPLKGTGLGLSIAKQYVEQHQGTIKLLNTRRGAAFQVSFRR